MSSSNAMNFGPAWYPPPFFSLCSLWTNNCRNRMRGDSSRILRGNPENTVNSLSPNGSGSFAAPPFPIDPSTTLQPPSLNGNANTSSVHGRTPSFSYSSILASAQPSHHATPGGEIQTGNGALTNHDKPFQYTREEMLNIWKSNAFKIKSSGIPLEFEKHETFTSNDTLEPVLLSDMTPAEREVFSCFFRI